MSVEQEARAEARRVVNAGVVLAALRTIGVGLASARGAHERAVAQEHGDPHQLLGVTR